MPRDQRGMITIWVLGLTVAVLFLSGLGVDLWHAIAARREMSLMADTAATAGANGLDESALRGGRLHLDDHRVRALVAAQLAQYSASSTLVDEQVHVVAAVGRAMTEGVDAQPGRTAPARLAGYAIRNSTAAAGHLK